MAAISATGMIVCFDTAGGGTGAVADRMRIQDNTATNKLANIWGQHLIAGGIFSAQGIYREA